MADITVNAGGNLQTALNSASGATSDRIICEAGATFTGPFTLPTKTGGRVTLTSSGTIPNRRIAIGDAGQLATITASSGSNWVLDGAGASNWNLDGLRFIPVAGTNNGVIDVIGETCANNIYSRLLFDGSGGVQKRFLRADGVNVLIKWLYVHDLHKPGTDGQGISCVKGAGPYTIYDCYINGGSECILFGGGGTSAAEHNPQDIVIEHCELSQPEGRYPTTHLAKNLFELKNATRVIFRYNILRDIEVSDQSATAIMLTPTNQESNAPWVRVYDVRIEHNRVWNVGRFLTITGYGYTGDGYTEGTKHLFTTMQTDIIKVRHNLVETIAERFIQAAGEVGSLTVEHNTHLDATQDDTLAIYFPNDAQCLRTGGVSGAQTYSVQAVTLRDNFIQGRTASPVAHGIANNTRSDIVPNMVTGTNVVGLDDPGSWTTAYPGFTREDLATYNANFAETGDFALDPDSPHHNTASDGTDKGWDLVDGAPTEASPGPTNIVWTSLTGSASASGNDLSGGPSSGALSTISITGDCDIEWVSPDNTSEMWVGLGTNPLYDLNGMSHAFEFGASVGVRELGVYKTDWGSYDDGDVFRINITGTTVKFYENDVLKYTSLTPLSFPTKLDVGFIGGGGSLTDATITTSGAQQNVMPTVNAGPDVTVLVGGTGNLSGLAVDDGQPSDTLTVQWSKVFGPGTVEFGDDESAETTASVSALGTYMLRLTATDGELSSYDDVLLMQTVPVPEVEDRRPTPRIYVGNTDITTLVQV